jgi:uncharacterized membrane protein YdbT with pleckstrin-like domain
MNELETNLLAGEEITFQTKKHWFALVRGSIGAILLLLLALVLRWLSPTGDGFLGSVGALVDLISFGILVVAIAVILYNVAVLLSANFGVTNMRVLRYEGIIQRRSSETLLTTLTDVKLVEPFIGRSLGFGDLQILTSSGKAGADEFKTVAGASRLRTAIQEQKARSEERRTEVAAAAVAAAAAPAMAAPAPAASAPAPVPLSAADEAANSLKLLADLRQQGLVTDEEYEAKRAEIVARL